MGLSKAIVSGTFTGTDGYRNLVVALKGGGVFGTADLAGTWHVFTFFDTPDLVGNDPGSARGAVRI
ncbi:MAG: hypothetical protein GY778_28305, partial [bacterium]|nr:hypothetical protein [bacterium]